MKSLVKLTNAHTSGAGNNPVIYVDLESAVAVCSGMSYDSNGNQEQYGTVIQFGNGATITVKEHLVEVIALIEGRDPKPAKLLYGKKQ